MVYRYKTKGTCSSEIELELKRENGSDIIERAKFVGGCAGNTQGISKLVAGMEAKDAIEKLEGILCGRKGTSCPDQLAIALGQAAALMDREEKPDYLKNYEKWMGYRGLDAKTKADLAEIGGDEKKIKEWFLAPLEFGTGGLRGLMRPGTNSMNVYVVKHVTQAIAGLIKSKGKEYEDKGAVIAYDSRNNSELFAKEAAKTLAANGIKTYIFDGIRPTPELSFAIRHLGCAAGINITASHNPKQYNGYKAYWEDGGQFPPDHAETVLAAINETDIFSGVLSSHYGEMMKQGRIVSIGEEFDREYLSNVLARSARPEAIRKAPEFKVAYTPLHGAGYKMVPEALRQMGLKNLVAVEGQMIPDGEFPKLEKPNPEDPEVFELGIETAKKENCSLVIATDPDCDRLGVAAETNGEFGTLTGNQIGALLLDYIIAAKKEDGSLKPTDCVVTTIVSTELASKICGKNGVKIEKVLTGFKFIAEKIKEFEQSGDATFLFGFEESYGYLAGTYARDKDAVSASALTVEMAAYYSKKGMTLFDALGKLYEDYGYCSETTQNIKINGIDWAEKMRNAMDKLRKNPPAELGGCKISGIIDYSDDNKPTGLPKSDVLCFVLDNGKVFVRPSGTEAKIKIYYLLSAKDENSAAGQRQKLQSAMEKLL
ncbi:MAG: TIGR03905 family TSCPD domain-containing protein [Oscillospiraceae bacterium]|nr:TIGR03905 family TSCPD domain-containing protein [Oscillospiraceae bacterium]